MAIKCNQISKVTLKQSTVSNILSWIQEKWRYSRSCTRIHQIWGVGTKANLFHKMIKARNENDQCFVVVCMYISPSFNFFLKELEFLLNDISILMGSLALYIGDMNTDLLKQNKLSSSISNLLQYNGMTQLRATARRRTIDSATLIDHALHNHFFVNTDYGILDAGLTDHCANFVKLPFCC